MDKAKRLILAMIWLNFIISICFALEVAMKSYAFGLRRAFAQVHWVIKAEFLYQPVVWTMWFTFLFNRSGDYGLEINIFSLGILLRALRVTGLLNEITLWRNFVRTIRALVRPFFNFSVTLYSLYLIYASIGLEFFGGKINSVEVNRLIDAGNDIDESWLYLNFNDYIMSLNTLFSFMWQNDWEAIVYMYELAFDSEKDTGVILYFVTFMELANLIFVNIIIAFVIDTYQSIDETLEAEQEARESKNQIEEDEQGGQNA